MRRNIVAIAVLSLAFTAQANDAVDLSSKSKAMAAAPTPNTKQVEAPFISGARDPLPQLLMQEEQDRRMVKGTCEAAASELCFDAATGRVVYRGARNYMPKVSGLTAENVSLRGRGITFKYSFK